MKQKPKKGPKYLIPPDKTPINPIPEKSVNLPVTISFQFHREGEKWCLSNCDKSDVRLYLKALRLLTTMKWVDVMGTGGKPYGGKVGLGYTAYPDLKFDEVSQDITISGLRAGERHRFYGYHLGQVYFVVRFDPKHEIVPAR